MELALIDWVIIVTFVLVNIGIGLFFMRRAGKNLSEYFVSGRSLPWWIAGTSMVATTFAADTPLAVTGLVVKHGIAGNWFWWAFAFGGMITVFVYSRLWRRSLVITDVEFISLRYSGKPATVLRVTRALYVSFIVNPIIIGWVVKAMMMVFKETVFYGRNISTAQEAAILLVLLAAVGLYCTVSGMWGVAFTDVIQFVIAMVGCIWLAVIVVNAAGGTEALQQKVVEQTGSEQVFSFLPEFSFDNPWMPVHVFLILLMVNWWATWFPGAEPGGGGYVVQRMAACRSERDAMLATLWYQVAHYCLRPWPWLIVALAALAFYPELRAGYLENGDDPGVGFPMIIRDYCPAGVRGLLLVAFLAAFMSTISTQMNWGASYLVRDVVQVVCPKTPETSLTLASRFLSVLVLVIGGAVGWLFHTYDVNVDTAWKFLAALGAGTGAVFMLRWFWWRINAWTEIVAMLAALIYFTILKVGGWLLPENIQCPLFRSHEVMMAVVALLTIKSWLIATLLTKPESEEILTRFYQTIRPGGPGWKPIARLVPKVQPDQNLALSIFAAFVGAALIYSLLPLVGALLFGNYTTAAVSGVVAISSGIALVFLVRRLATDD